MTPSAGPIRLRRPATWPGLPAGVIALTLTGLTPDPATAQNSVATVDIRPAQTPIVVDGRLDEVAWREARVIALPFETWPSDNVPALASTECRITYSTSHLYFGCRAAEPEAGSIRAYLTDRDDVDEQDRIGLLIDPFRDSRRGYGFSVTATGVQSDFIMSAGDDGGSDWDAIWDAEAVRTEDGFVVEAAIPFRSLRFPAGEGVQTWNYYFWRNRPRSVTRNFHSVAIDRSNQCELCQLGSFSGLASVAPGRNVEVTPSMTTARLDQRNDATGGLSSGPVEPEVGLDLRWSLTSNVTLNATLNPDFNQVEADAGQLQANQQFALFFPERRPFFLEGAELFQTLMRTVFTRSIADPTHGVKLSGKRDAWAFGALLARDQRTNFLFPGSRSSSSGTLESEAGTAILRVRRDVGESSTLGALFTNRQGDQYYNRLGSVDANIRLARSLALQAQVARSDTRYPVGVAGTHDQPTGSLTGAAASARLDLESRSWYGNLQSNLVEPGFRADAGFVTEADSRFTYGFLGRRWWPSTSVVSRVQAGAGAGYREDWAGNTINRYIWGIVGYVGGLQSELTLNPDYFEEFIEGQRFHIGRLNVFGEVQPLDNLEFGFFGQFGEAVDFANVRTAGLLRVQPSVDARIGQNVQLRLFYDLRRLTRDGGTVFTEQLFRIRGVYYFDRRLFARALVQLRDLERHPALYRDVVSRGSTSLDTQLLLAYKINPLSVAYLGYSDDAIDLRESQDTRSNGLVRMSRSFFLKLSYAWRP